MSFESSYTSVLYSALKYPGSIFLFQEKLFEHTDFQHLPSISAPVVFTGYASILPLLTGSLFLSSALLEFCSASLVHSSLS